MESSNPILVTEFNDELMAFFLALDRTTESWHRGSQGNDNGDIPVPLDADSEFLRHRELTFESRKKVLNLAPQVISTIIPPPEQSATQFVAEIVNNVDRAWHLCRFMHCIEAGDEPKTPEMIHVWNDMRTRLPALRNSLWEASRYIGTTLNLQPEPDNVAGDCVILRQMADQSDHSAVVSALKTLEQELSKEWQRMETSTLDELDKPPPIRGRSLYIAVQNVEQHYKGKLPSKPRAEWRKMLKLNDDENWPGDIKKTVKAYFQACDNFLEWVKLEITDKEPVRRKEEQEEWLGGALILLKEHPDWSDAKIAKSVGKHKSTLSRNQTYQMAAKMARGNKEDRHRGHITADPETGQQDVEGYAEDPDLDE